MTRYAFRRYDQFETCPEAIEQELRPAVIVLMILCSYVTLHTWFVFGVDTYLVLYCDVGHRVPPFSRNEETVSTGSKLQHNKISATILTYSMAIITVWDANFDSLTLAAPSSRRPWRTAHLTW